MPYSNSVWNREQPERRRLPGRGRERSRRREVDVLLELRLALGERLVRVGERQRLGVRRARCGDDEERGGEGSGGDRSGHGKFV